MKLIAPGQLRISSDGFVHTDGAGTLYLVVGPTEKPGVWNIMRETGDLERWWVDGLDEDEVVAEAQDV